MSQQRTERNPTPRGVMLATMILGVIILLPSMAGFVNKFYEFASATRDNADGAYVLTPMINYFLASCGFFCLLMWAALHGMFHDIEAPKQIMLAREAELDAHETVFTPRWAGGSDRLNLQSESRQIVDSQAPQSNSPGT